MKTDIIIAGVGGQGIISIAAAIGIAALANKLYFKQAEVHGMSQRGGAVQSHFRLSDTEIASDLISYGGADLIISVEPMESLRYLPYLNENGWLVTNTRPYLNITNYPELTEIINEIKKVPHHLALDADAVAEDIGSIRSSNMVVLGAASPFVNVSFESLEEGVKNLFADKGESIINSNIKALHAGRAFADKNK